MVLELKTGDNVKIKGYEYEVVKVVPDSDYNSKTGVLIDYVEYQLHDIKKKKLLPEAYLSVYPNGKIKFYLNESLSEKDIEVCD